MKKKNKILAFEKITFKKDERMYDDFDGYLIVTEEGNIRLGISNSQSCCESWGYYSTPDEIQDFIGADFQGIEVVDDALDKKKLEEVYYEGGAMFVNILTSKGVLQFTLYNSHNGYYGHTAVIISKFLNAEEYL